MFIMIPAIRPRGRRYFIHSRRKNHGLSRWNNRDRQAGDHIGGAQYSPEGILGTSAQKPRALALVGSILGNLGIILFILGCQSKQVEYINSEETQHKNEFSKNVSMEKQSLKEISYEEKKITSGRNPFLTLDEEKEFGAKKEAINYLNLSAVFYAPGRSYAVIDGRIVREKDTIDNKEIVKINPESVVLKDDAGAEYIIEMGKM